MAFIIISVIVSVGFMVISAKGSRIETAQRMQTATKWVGRMLLMAPAIAFVVFLVLFATVLKGRLLERSSHALMVFGFWLYATAFYNNILKYLKSKPVLLASLAGMLICVPSAIIITPLDRYCDVVHYPVWTAMHNPWQILAYLPGVIMLVMFYISALKFSGKNGR